MLDCAGFCAARKIWAEVCYLAKRLVGGFWALKIIDRRLTTVDRRTVRPREKIAAAIYSTPEYKAWALAVKERARWSCEECGTRSGRLYADHIVELEDGGAPFDVQNGQCLCHQHHSEKTVRERAKRARS